MKAPNTSNSGHKLINTSRALNSIDMDSIFRHHKGQEVNRFNHKRALLKLHLQLISSHDFKHLTQGANMILFRASQNQFHQNRATKIPKKLRSTSVIDHMKVEGSLDKPKA